MFKVGDKVRVICDGPGPHTRGVPKKGDEGVITTTFNRISHYFFVTDDGKEFNRFGNQLEKVQESPMSEKIAFQIGDTIRVIEESVSRPLPKTSGKKEPGLIKVGTLLKVAELDPDGDPRYQCSATETYYISKYKVELVVNEVNTPTQTTAKKFPWGWISVFSIGPVLGLLFQTITLIGDSKMNFVQDPIINRGLVYLASVVMGCLGVGSVALTATPILRQFGKLGDRNRRLKAEKQTQKDTAELALFTKLNAKYGNKI